MKSRYGSIKRDYGLKIHERLLGGRKCVECGNRFTNLGSHKTHAHGFSIRVGR